MGVLWEPRYRVGQTLAWQSGDDRRSGVVHSYLQGADGAYTLWVHTDEGPATVIEAQVLRAGDDGEPGPAGAVAGVDGAEAERLARAILAGASIRWPVQRQLLTLAMAVVGQVCPAPAAEPDPGSPGLAHASGTGGRS